MRYIIRKRILQIPSARSGRGWLKKIRFRKYENLSLYRFLKIFAHNINEDEILDRANSVSFNFILAIFPAIIFLFTLIPYISTLFPAISHQSVLNFLSQVMPPSMSSVAADTIMDIVNNQRGGLLTFGFLFAVYLATNGMMALMRAFNACYRTVERRSFWRMQFTALSLTAMLALALISAATLLIVGQLVLEYVTANVDLVTEWGMDSYTIHVLFVIRFLIIFLMFFLAISCIYYFGPAVHYNWSFFSVGSFIATLACLGVSYGFSFYVTNFGSYNKVYGSIGALLALMIWIQLLTIVLLFGYEINASLHYGRKMQAIDAGKKTSRKEKALR